MSPLAAKENTDIPTGERDILVESHIVGITMPENLRVGRIVSEHRAQSTCLRQGLRRTMTTDDG
jgi:hypothetical protein